MVSKDLEIRINRKITRWKKFRRIKKLLGALTYNQHSISSSTASSALIQLGKPVTRILVKYLPSKDSKFGCRVIYILGEIGDARRIDTIIKMLDFVSFKDEAYIALEKIDDNRTIEPLLKGLESNLNIAKINGIKNIYSESLRIIPRALAKKKVIGAIPQIIELFELCPSFVEILSNELFASICAFEDLAIEPLIQAILNTKYTKNQKYIDALVKIGKPSIENLSKVLNSELGNNNKHIIMALDKINQSKNST